jgi:hypothetical protein
MGQAVMEAGGRQTQTLDNKDAVTAYAPLSTHSRKARFSASCTQEVASPVDTTAVEKIVDRAVERVVVRQTTMEVEMKLQGRRLGEIQSAQLALSRQLEAVLDAIGTNKEPRAGRVQDSVQDRGATTPPLPGCGEPSLPAT